jgi:hypothetical protein
VKLLGADQTSQLHRKEDYTKAKTLAFEAAKSRAWLYPLKVQILDLPAALCEKAPAAELPVDMMHRESSISLPIARYGNHLFHDYPSISPSMVAS